MREAFTTSLGGKVKKFLLSVSMLALMWGMASAQSGDNFNVNSHIKPGEKGDVSVTQDLNVTIPPRLALHINKTAWNLNLDDAEDLKEYCVAVPKKATLLKFVDEVRPDYWDMVKLYYKGLYPYSVASSYPVVDIDGDGTISGNEDKGYLYCTFDKIVQKFSNSGNGWVFDVALSAPEGQRTGFGEFYLSDSINDWVYQGSMTTRHANGARHIVAGDKGERTRGWLDDYIHEAFYFDGSEIAGDYDLVVTYTLTSQF